MLLIPEDKDHDFLNKSSRSYYESESDNDEEIINIKEFKLNIQQEIGKGSFGTVYKAIDLEDNEECAVKILDKQKSKYSDIEHSILAKLRHPQIVQLKRICQTKQKLYLIMELVSGGSLKDVLSRKRDANEQLTDEEISLIMKQLFSAVDAMHNTKVIHRDIKLENVLFKKPNDLDTLKLADFGLSIQVQNISQTCQNATSKIGTLLFMSPEQLTNQQYGKGVDVWSCGIIMYELFSMGRHPFYSGVEKQDQFIQNVIQHNWNFTNNFSNLAQDFLMKICCHDPSNRYSAAQALRHPWITRNLNEQIPQTIKDMQQTFMNQINFEQIIKSLMFIKYIEMKAKQQNCELEAKHQLQTKIVINNINKKLSNGDPIINIFNEMMHNQQQQHFQQQLQIDSAASVVAVQQAVGEEEDKQKMTLTEYSIISNKNLSNTQVQKKPIQKMQTIHKNNTNNNKYEIYSKKCNEQFIKQTPRQVKVNVTNLKIDCHNFSMQQQCDKSTNSSNSVNLSVKSCQEKNQIIHNNQVQNHKFDFSEQQAGYLKEKNTRKSSINQNNQQQYMSKNSINYEFQEGKQEENVDGDQQQQNSLSEIKNKKPFHRSKLPFKKESIIIQNTKKNSVYYSLNNSPNIESVRTIKNPNIQQSLILNSICQINQQPEQKQQCYNRQQINQQRYSLNNCYNRKESIFQNLSQHTNINEIGKQQNKLILPPINQREYNLNK